MARTGKELYANIKLTTSNQTKLLTKAKRKGYKVYLCASLEIFGICKVLKPVANLCKMEIEF